jgi:hypothetical protein
MCSSTLSLTSALDGVGGQRHAPAALPPGKTWYPLYRRLGRPQDRSGQVRKISPPPGFDPRTVQPAASRYTDWAHWRSIPKRQLKQLFSISVHHSGPEVWPSNTRTVGSNPIRDVYVLFIYSFVYKALHTGPLTRPYNGPLTCLKSPTTCSQRIHFQKTNVVRNRTGHRN